MKGFIPTSFFGYCSYILAIVTGASPWLFGFAHFGGACLFLPLLFGWFQLIMSIFSNTEGGMVGVFPVQMHAVLDVISGFVLLVSPFLYGFTPNVWAPHVILGGLLFLFGIGVKNSPFTNKPHKPLPEGSLESTDSTEGRLYV